MTAVPTPAAGDREGQVAEEYLRHTPLTLRASVACTCGWRGRNYGDHAEHVARALLAPNGPVGVALAEARREALLEAADLAWHDGAVHTAATLEACARATGAGS